MKKYDLAPGDFPEITSFSSKLTETKFSEFNTLSESKIAALDSALNVEIPKLMEMLPSEKDSPETIRSKMGGDEGIASVPVPITASKFGKQDNQASNPFGVSSDNVEFWYVAP